MSTVTIFIVVFSLGFVCLALPSDKAKSTGKQLSRNSTVKPNGVCNVIHNYIHNHRATSCQEIKALVHLMSKQLNSLRKQLVGIQVAVNGTYFSRKKHCAHASVEIFPEWKHETRNCYFSSMFFFFFIRRQTAECCYLRAWQKDHQLQNRSKTRHPGSDVWTAEQQNMQFFAYSQHQLQCRKISCNRSEHVPR